MAIGPKDIGRFFEIQNQRFGKCLAPEMTCPRPAIRSHSIQNARVIDLLEDDGHVTMLRIKHDILNPEMRFERVGRNFASTFTGFCSDHDARLFAPIDTRAFDVGDAEQLFLLAYRSITRELHAIFESVPKMQSAYSFRVEKGLDPKNQPSPAGMLATTQMLLAHSTWLYRAQYFDIPLVTGRHDAIIHDVVTLEEQPPALAVSSAFSLDKTNRAGNPVRIALNMFPENHRRTLVVFSYTKSDHKIARLYLRGLLNAHGIEQKLRLSALVLAKVENFVIAPSHFEKWDAEKTKKIEAAFVKTLFGQQELDPHHDLMLF